MFKVVVLCACLWLAGAEYPLAVLSGGVFRLGHWLPRGELCPRGGAGLRAALLVASPPARAAPRRRARLTWAHYARRSDIAVAFVLGSAAAPRRGSRLAREAALHGDLVVGNFTDSRRNASLRALSMLEWALDRCPLAPFIMKVEDHVFVNVPNVLRFVEHHKYEVRTAWGSLAREAGGEYLRGDAYILTADLAGALLRRVWREAYSPHEARFVWRLLAGAAAAAAHEPGLAAPPPAPARALAVPRVPFKGALALWEQLYH